MLNICYNYDLIHGEKTLSKHYQCIILMSVCLNIDFQHTIDLHERNDLNKAREVFNL